jgi:hypothetical protein
LSFTLLIPQKFPGEFKGKSSQVKRFFTSIQIHRPVKVKIYYYNFVIGSVRFFSLPRGGVPPKIKEEVLKYLMRYQSIKRKPLNIIFIIYSSWFAAQPPLVGARALKKPSGFMLEFLPAERQKKIIIWLCPR